MQKSLPFMQSEVESRSRSDGISPSTTFENLRTSSSTGLDADANLNDNVDSSGMSMWLIGTSLSELG